jgi:hypothetical protein
MSSAIQIPETLTVSESQAWLQENMGALVTLDDTAFILAIHEFKASIPNKPRVSKKKTPIMERADAPYDEDKCDARVWLKPGNFAGQCSCKKVDGQFLCKRHQSESEKHSGVTRNGFYNQERPTHAFCDTEDELLGWHDVVIEKAAKKQAGSKTSGERKARNCGNCGQSGHDKRKCPEATTNASAPPMSIADLEALLAAAKESLAAAAKEEESLAAAAKEEESLAAAAKEESIAAAAKEESIAAAAKEEDSLVVALDALELEEDTPLSPKSQAAAGTGLSVEPEEEEDLAPTDDEELSTIDCSLDGVPYTRNGDGAVLDDDFDTVGSWVDGKIVFDNPKMHRFASEAAAHNAA